MADPSRISKRSGSIPRTGNCMDEYMNDSSKVDRRDFFKAAGAGLATAGVLLTPRDAVLAQSVAEKARLDRIAGWTLPIRELFKTRQAPRPGGGGGGAPPRAVLAGALSFP